MSIGTSIIIKEMLFKDIKIMEQINIKYTIKFCG